jgi:hypothetical protein
VGIAEWPISPGNEHQNRLLISKENLMSEPILTSPIIGGTRVENGKVLSDESSLLIDELIHHRFTRVAQRGWYLLYLDPVLGNYWELSYPQGNLHGGGPPRLDQLTASDVLDLYGSLPTTKI